MRKNDYWKVGGCEEDLVGNYGQTDPIFWYRAKDKLKINYQKDMYLNYIPKGASKIKRDGNKNKKLFEENIPTTIAGYYKSGARDEIT